MRVSKIRVAFCGYAVPVHNYFTKHIILYRYTIIYKIISDERREEFWEGVNHRRRVRTVMRKTLFIDRFIFNFFLCIVGIYIMYSLPACTANAAYKYACK